MTADSPPLERIYDLGDLSQAGAHVVVAVEGEDLVLLAHWIGVDAVEGFRADIELRRLSSSRFSLQADLAADVVQACVVTLDPVQSHIARNFVRELILSPSAYRRSNKEEAWPVAPVEDDSPEEIASLHYDLLAPLLEELVLAIDPYPRASGVAFEPPASADAASERPESPFAVLKDLKNRP
jgi:uncharacterized metal-binding protein YceD (DUF177 family)